MIAVAKKYSGSSQVGPGNFGLATNEVRPVKFWAKVQGDIYGFRLAMQTLGKLVWSNYQWIGEDEFNEMMEMVLDPVITVHDDRVFFEAFNQDQSAYGLVIANRDMFDPDGEVQTGTTNIDFTYSLYTALAHMRSDKETWFRVGPGGLIVETESAGAHIEEKVDLPIPWLRGFLQLQSAMALPGTRVEMRPIEVLNILRFVRENQALRSPRSLRFEFEPGQNTKVVLEPWDKVIELKNATHRYSKTKVTRIWGRRRLDLIEPLLPYADSVKLYLKGRALPSFWAIEMGDVTFVLGMSGWTGNNWTQAGSFDLMNPKVLDEKSVDDTLAVLAKHQKADDEDVAGATGLTSPQAQAALSELCRRGRAIYDVETRTFRHRELFPEPIDLDAYYPVDERITTAIQLEADDLVTISSDGLREMRKADSIFFDRVIGGNVDGEDVEIVLKDSGQMIFGQCSCAFFQENLMALGPCAHMIALRSVADRTEED